MVRESGTSAPRGGRWCDFSLSREFSDIKETIMSLKLLKRYPSRMAVGFNEIEKGLNYILACLLSNGQK